MEKLQRQVNPYTCKKKVVNYGKGVLRLGETPKR